MEEKEEIKPCPFCGGEPVFRSVNGASGIRNKYFRGHIECKVCKSKGPGMKSPDKVVKAWNKRATA